MKNLKFFFLSFLFTSVSVVGLNAQSFDQFLKYEGVKTLASLAHPSNDFYKGNYQVFNDHILVNIYYRDGVRTRLRLGMNKGWFTSVQVLFDDDWFPPFLGVELMKDILLELSKEWDTDQTYKVRSSYEQWLNKRIESFSGKDITLLVMTMSWFAY